VEPPLTELRVPLDAGRDRRDRPRDSGADLRPGEDLLALLESGLEGVRQLLEENMALREARKAPHELPQREVEAEEDKRREELLGRVAELEAENATLL
jgi:hypothetical protein